MTQIHSLAGILDKTEGLIKYSPFHMPHHSASTEGIICGDKVIRPGEVSLVHHGILFLDEAPAFKKGVLQALREPIEAERLIITLTGEYDYTGHFYSLKCVISPILTIIINI